MRQASPSIVNTSRLIHISLTVFILLSMLKLTAQTLNAEPENKLEQAIAELVIDGKNHGTVSFYLDDEGRLFFPSYMLKQELENIIRPDIIRRFDTPDRLVSTEELEQLGISVRFDREKLVLDFFPAASARKSIGIGLTQQRSPNPYSINIKTAPISLLLPLRLDLGTSHKAFTSESNILYDITLSLDPAFRAFNIVAEGSLDLKLASEQDARINIRRARLVYDILPLGSRITGGVIVIPATSFQNPAEIYGISFAKEWSIIGKVKNAEPLIKEIIIERDADVSIEINGIVVRRLLLSPGLYHLSDLPLATGLNAVAIIIEERGLEPRVLRVEIPFEDSILAPNELDYAFSVGLMHEDPSNPIASLKAAYGIAQGIQFGVDLEADSYSFLGGVSAIGSLSVGTISGKAAMALPFGTITNETLSFAAQASWYFSTNSSRYIPKIGAAVEYRSSGFSAPGSTVTERFPSLNISAQLGQTLPEKIGAVSAYGDVRLLSDAIVNWSASLGLTIPLTTTTSLSLSGGADWNSDAGISPRMNMSLFTVSNDRTSLSYRRDIVGEIDYVSLVSSLDEKKNASLGLFANGLSLVDSSHDISVAASYRSSLAALQASMSYRDAQTWLSPEIAGAVSISSTIVTANGVLAASSVSSDSFALIIPSKDLYDQQIDLHISGGPRTSSVGTRAFLVPGLSAYREYEATLEMPNSPPDTRPSPGLVTLKPAYRSIASLSVGLESSSTLRGVLVDTKGEIVRYMPGVVFGPGNERLGSTFTDESGVFEYYGVIPGTITIVWGDGSETRHQISDQSINSVYDLGIVTVYDPSGDGG